MSAHIDTSVLGTYYCPEPGSVAAEMVSLQTLDTLYLAAAMTEALPLATSDGPLATAAKRHKHKVVWAYSAKGTDLFFGAA